ncbi:MAG: hypothetical protein ACI4LC_01355 [Emergencia sp.]
MNFKQLFFRIYDRKIASGEISFSRSGIKKDDFTRLCTEDGFVLSRDAIELIAVNMKLTEEEKNQLIEASEREGTK